MRIGKKLESLRANLGLQQDKVAEILGVSKSTISHWEGDNREPSFDMLDKLAELYKTSVPAIFSDGNGMDLLSSTIVNMGKGGMLTEEGLNAADESVKGILLSMFDLHIKALLKENK